MSAMTGIESSPQLKPANPQSEEIFPGIFITPGVCGGDACVGNTRITVHGLVEWRRLGMDDKELLYNFPSLNQDDLDNARKYAPLHEEEIQRQIDENNSDEEFAGIEFTPDVSGGNACIKGRTIPVWKLVLAQRKGSSDADILKAYPSLYRGDLSNAWYYAEFNKEEIERQIEANSTTS